MNNVTTTLLILLITSIWFFIYDYTSNDTWIAVSTIAIVTGFIIVVLSLRLAYRHSKTVCMGKALLFLALAFLCYSIAETIWMTDYMNDVDVYPSYADIFYTGYYAFIILFMLNIFNMFIGQHSVKYISFIVLSVIAVTGTYYAMSYESDSDVLWLGATFVALSTFISAVSVTLAVRFHVRGVKIIWVLMSLVLILNGVGDVGYYTLENIGVYDYDATIDTMWFAGNLLLIMLLLGYERYEKKT